MIMMYRLFQVIDITGAHHYFIADCCSPDVLIRFYCHASFRYLCLLGQPVTIAQYAKYERTSCIWSATIDYQTDTITICTYTGLPYQLATPQKPVIQTIHINLIELIDKQ